MKKGNFQNVIETKPLFAFDLCAYFTTTAAQRSKVLKVIFPIRNEFEVEAK